MPAEGIEIVQRPRLRENSGSMEFAETKEVSRRSLRELKFVRYTLRCFLTKNVAMFMKNLILLKMQDKRPLNTC